MSWIVENTPATKHLWSFNSCLNFTFMDLNVLRRPLIVSCRARTFSFAFFSDRVIQLSGFIIVDSPRYPRSASTFSPLSNFWRNPCRKIFRSGQAPQGKGPLTETTSPVKIQTATSYLTPAPLILWLYHLRSNGKLESHSSVFGGSAMGKSVQSTVVLQVRYLLPPPLPIP